MFDGTYRHFLRAATKEREGCTVSGGRGGLPRPPRCTTLVIVMVVVVMMVPAPPTMVVMVMPVPPPAMMMVMMVGEQRFTAGRRLGVLPFVRHERGQGIRDRIEKLPLGRSPQHPSTRSQQFRAAAVGSRISP